jgi:2-polyprenyl-6-methoxyphenol hydroxylase-like FAD-dependent oxidoreductase
MPAPAKHVVVIGGSVAGLGVALALSGRGHRVTILEADATPLPASHGEAFARWKRRGAPQTRHSHALLARLRNLIRDHAPELLEKLVACGAEELRFTDRARELFADPELKAGDEDIVALACRRITFEWILRRHVLDTGLVELRDGVAVERLDAVRDEATGLPRVTGVWAGRRDSKGGAERISADLVVDASGRRPQLLRWLPEIGARAVREASSPCGIFYTSRFYRLREGVEPPSFDGGIVGADLGYLKVGIFAGDSRVFSITLAASPTDTEMRRRLLRQPGFEAAVAAVPIAAEWTSPALSEPVSDVHGMANLTNTRRWLVEGGEPLALGFVAVGDSLIHTNPIVGRGCSHAWTAAFALADCLDAHGGDLRALALAYDACIERDIVPWYELQVAQDRDAIEVAEAQQRGEDPFLTTRPDGTQDPKAFMRSLVKEGLLPALREDLVLLRVFLRTIHLLDPPGDLMKNPVVLQRVLDSWARRDQREKVTLGPSRAAMLERFAALG